MTDRVRVIIVDDSAIFRELVDKALAQLDGVDVVGRAKNGAEAVKLALSLRPDAMTLDLNMPVLDGLGVLRQLREAKSDCDVVVVSSETREAAQVTVDALLLGAVDFITKPAENGAAASLGVLSMALRRQIAALRLRRQSRSARGPRKDAGVAPAAVEQKAGAGPLELVTIGTSTGGPTALPVVLEAIPAGFRVPILIVQHMPPLFTATLAESLTKRLAIPVFEGRDGQLVKAGQAYLAPGGRHMKLKRAFDGALRLQIVDDPPENHCRPSVDVLFRSVAEELPGRTLAVILTGMGSDGVAGLTRLRTKGATILAQDEATSVVFGMPGEAVRAGVVDAVLPLPQIGSTIVQLVQRYAP